MDTDRIVNFIPKGDRLKYPPAWDKELEPVRLLHEICSLIKEQDDAKNAILVLNNVKTANKNMIYNERNGSYILDNYYIVPGFYQNSSQEFINNLKNLDRLGFCRTSAPKIVDNAKTKDDRFALYVYRINDTKGGILLSYLDVRKQVPSEKKENFLQEQAVLLQNTSKYNPAILESFDNWGVTPDTYNIFIDSWNNLKKCKTQKERQQLREQWEELLK